MALASENMNIHHHYAIRMAYLIEQARMRHGIGIARLLCMEIMALLPEFSMNLDNYMSHLESVDQQPIDILHVGYVWCDINTAICDS